MFERIVRFVTVWLKVFGLEAQKPEFNLALLLTLALEGKLGKVGSSALNKAFGTLTKGMKAPVLMSRTRRPRW